MGWTKREIIVQAFEDIGLASYVFDLSAEQLQSALRRLDLMLASWNARGVRIGYAMPSTAGGSSLDEQSGVPDSAFEAIVSNLAIRLASSVGKTPSPELKLTAKQGLDALMSKAAIPPEMQMPSGTPSGAGSKNVDAPFLDDPLDLIDVGPDGELEVQ